MNDENNNVENVNNNEKETIYIAIFSAVYNVFCTN